MIAVRYLGSFYNDLARNKHSEHIVDESVFSMTITAVAVARQT